MLNIKFHSLINNNRMRQIFRKNKDFVETDIFYNQGKFFRVPDRPPVQSILIIN